MRKLGAFTLTVVLASFLAANHHSLIFSTEVEVQQAIKDLREAGLMSPSPWRVSSGSHAD
jgi:hypothetical protein|tara:strand:- start:1033 stop:1212 length:180 start_codon:yes stop_codon:yes gene_type:complete